MKYVAALVVVLFLLWMWIRSPSPDYVETHKTPIPGVTLTFETWSLPLTSDFNRLVVHYDHNGKRDSRFILEGDYAEFYKYVWPNPQHLVLCWKNGRVYNFTNQIDLQAGGARQHFHVTLAEDCW